VPGVGGVGIDDPAQRSLAIHDETLIARLPREVARLLRTVS
jgi:hypothetical protein